MEPLHLPHLEERTLARFDELAKKEKIFYEEAVSELITVNGFNVSHTFVFQESLSQFLFQLCSKRNPCISSKPLHITEK